jgi:hypothetical protein
MSGSFPAARRHPGDRIMSRLPQEPSRSNGRRRTSTTATEASATPSPNVTQQSSKASINAYAKAIDGYIAAAGIDAADQVPVPDGEWMADNSLRA